MSSDVVMEDPDDVGEAVRWRTVGRECIYSSKWMSLDLVEVVPPARDAYKHHVVGVPSAVGVIIRRDDGKVLLLHRHRFITNTTGYEVPAGAINQGESVEDAARREVLEETGFQIRGLTPTFSCSASDGVTDQRFHLLVGDVGADTGVVVDDHESSSRVWVDRDRLSDLLQRGLVPGALTSIAILHSLWFGKI